MSGRNDEREPLVTGRAEAEAVLRAIGTQSGAELDLAEGALALGALERPQVDLGRYRHHLTLLVRDVAEIAARHADSLAARVSALNETIIGKYGYRGDGDTYDDLQNANMLRVIDRRRGLPVTLGILYIHAARAQGWGMVGLAFPGHFLVRLDSPDGRVIIDPFNEGVTPDAAALRKLLQATAGDGAQLSPDHYAEVGDRSILLRLQNNLKLRLIGADQIAKAAAVVDTMLLFAPDEPDLWREAALLNAHVGNLAAAIGACEAFLERAAGDTGRHRIAALLQRLRGQLN